MTKQAYPPSITGLEESLHPGSVIDHKFGTSEAYTLGVEEEYMLLDGETFDLVQHIDTVLGDLLGHEHEDRINAELMQSTVEIATPVCKNVAEAETALRTLRKTVWRSPTRAGCASARRARIPSASSSASGSRRATAIGHWSTSSST